MCLSNLILLTACSQVPALDANPVTQSDTEALNNGTQDLSEKSAKYFQNRIETLQNTNSDICAWLYIEELGISHPVVKCINNEQYISQSYNNAYNPNGTLFFDEEVKSLTESNLIIYGSSSEYGPLETFSQQESLLGINAYLILQDGLETYNCVVDTETDDLYSYLDVNPDDVNTVILSENTYPQDTQILTISSQGDTSDSRRVVQFLRVT